MAGYFFDTSGLVKRYVAETGTAWVNSLLHPTARIALYLSRITGVELVAAITRRCAGAVLLRRLPLPPGGIPGRLRKRI